MSEDLKDQLESLHEKEAKSIDTIKELPAGSNKGKKIMIAYFTWGGRTGEVAHSIQQKIGGDIYEIKRDPDYSKEYNAVLKEAAAETDSNARPKLAGTQPDLKQYDVLVLGYPAWWFTAPMVIPSFLEQQDLKGKLIVPFMCSYSSPIEVTIPAIAAAAPGAKIFQGLTLDANTSYNVIDPWLTKAGLM
jgi:flavodoxin